VRGGDEREVGRAGEHQVARLVADQQGARDVRGAARVTTLMLSDRWLTTQTSSRRARRPRPARGRTGTRADSARPPSVTLKISSEPLGVLTATAGAVGDSAIGRTWPLSNSRNDGEVTAAGGAWRSAGGSDEQPRRRPGRCL